MEQYNSGLRWDSIYSNQHRQNAEFYQFTELAVKLLFMRTNCSRHTASPNS